MFVKKMDTKGIASGVGLASEAIADHKEKKEIKGRSPSPHPLGTTLSNEKSEKRYLDEDSSSDSEDDDEAEWQLDDAAQDFSAPPTYDQIEKDQVVDPDSIAKSFLKAHQISSTPDAFREYKPLPCPVILPQRRPKAKERGFVRAYAPVLDGCSGIDQKTFMDFLNAFDKASKASPVFDVINLACFAVGFVPNPIAMAVSTAVQVANRTGQELQSRYRRNTYLDQINETMFKPRGLYCMIMTYRPKADAVMSMNLQPSDQALAKVLSEPSSDLNAKLRKIRLTSGAAEGEISLPEAAPLIYPALDNASEQMSESDKNILKSSSQFVNSYLDRKAHATYASSNPAYENSKLVVPESERQFKSKYADPNHPIHAGTIWGLVTGGRYGPVAEKRARKAQRRAGYRGIQLTEEELNQAKMGRKLDPSRSGKRKGLVGLALTPVKKAIQKDILYLTIVNLPSESEMLEIRQELERMKSR